jgi:hypothetical protein
MKVIAPPLVHGGARGAGLTMLLNQVGVNAAGDEQFESAPFKHWKREVMLVAGDGQRY